MRSLFGIGFGLWLVALASSPALAQADGAADVPLLEKMRRVEADPALSEAAFKRGAKLSNFCANCHGANGNSTTPDTPNLAGQNPRYVLGQMLKFADGRRRNEFMQGLIKAMSADERIDTALYFSRQPVTTQPSADAALVAQGKSYYDKVCFRCHGADGHGNESYARLAGQQMPYVTRTLTRYREGGGTRMDPLMAAATQQMDDATIRAVAAYVSSLR